MTDLEHEQVFFDFVKQHDLLQHLTYSDTPISGQKVIGLLVDDADDINRENDNYVPYYSSFVKPLLADTNNAIIDPNWDNIYINFISLDHNLESIEYIKSLVESKTTREEVAQLVIDLILKKLIASNINVKTVYVVINQNWNTDWLDNTIEVE
jgi:hypothetical protein